MSAISVRSDKTHKRSNHMPAPVVTLKELIKEPRNPERVETHLQILRQKLHDLLSMDFKSYPNTQWQQVAPTVLEVLKNLPDSESIVEECGYCLYYVSKLDPSFKKGVARLFKAMNEYPDNVSIQRSACAAVRNVVVANPESCKRIAPSISTILDLLRRFPEDGNIAQSALAILTNLAYHPELQQQLIASRAVPQTIGIMKHQLSEPSIQAAAFQALANLLSCSTAVIATTNEPPRGGENSNFGGSVPMEIILNIRLLLKAMKVHLSHIQVQRFGCCILRNLLCLTQQQRPPKHQHKRQQQQQQQQQQHLQQLLVPSASSIRKTILEAMSSTSSLSSSEKKKDVIELQQHACAALLVLLDDSYSSAGKVKSEQQQRHESAIISRVVQAMKMYPRCKTIQQSGLQVIYKQSLFKPLQQQQQQQTTLEEQELILSEGGLDVILGAMSRDHQEAIIRKTPGNSTATIIIQRLGCELLKQFSRQGLDFQRAIVAKNGIPVVLTSMRQHVDHLAIQDAALATMRNLAANPHNREPIVSEGGISVILATMIVHSQEGPIQAYGCDALGRIAFASVDYRGRTAVGSDDYRTTIHSQNGVEVAMNAMRIHVDHAGVQDRAVFLLLALSDHRPSLVSMEEKGLAKLLLKHTKVPNRKESIDRVKTLIERVESVHKKGWLGW